MKLNRIILYTFFATTILQAHDLQANDRGIPELIVHDTLIVTDSASQQFTDSLIKFALQYEGVPYRSGGTSKDGFDCSGFCSHVFKSFGMEIPRTSRDQSTVGMPVDFENIQAGDLMFFKGSRSGTVGHVALVIRREGDDIWMIHASSIRHRVVIDRYQDLGYYMSRYVGARRLFPISKEN